MKFYRITHGGHKPWAQTFRIMKLTVILLFGSLMAMSATTYSQNTKLNLSAKNSSLIDIFRQIEDQSEFYFYFKKEEVKSKEPVSVELKDALVTDILDQILDRTGLEYKIIDRYIVVKPKGTADPEMTMQRERKITGKVTDQSAISLPGVSVVVKGTTKGVITDNDGNFSIDLPDDAKILTFSFVGMRTQEVVLTNKTIVNITMAEEAIGLEEIVAVGYGTQKKVTLTGSVASVKSEDIITTKSQSLENTLTGKIPGVRVVQKTSEPGTFSNVFDIRGLGTPLIIIDGVPRDNIDRLDPNEIESISVLKDGSAAVYGVRAANGVVLVTTKRGSRGKAQIEYTGYYGFQTAIGLPDPVDAVQRFTLMNERAMHNVNGGTPYYSDADFAPYLNGTQKSTDWYNLVMQKNAPQSQHNLNISGGSQDGKIDYFINTGYTYQDGYWKTNDLNYNRYNLRSNVNAQITDRLKVSVKINAIMDTQNSTPPNSWEIFKSIWRAQPNETFYANNNPNYLFKTVADHPGALTDASIMGYKKYENKWIQSQAELEYDLPYIKGLKAKGMFSYDMILGDNAIYRKSYSLYSYNAASDIYTGYQFNLPDQVSRTYSKRPTSLWQISLNYNHSFNKVHNLGALLLYEESTRSSDNFNASRQLSIPVPYLFAGKAVSQVGSADYNGIWKDANKGLVGKFNYDYRGKYIAEFSFRYDGSSKFPVDKQWGFFPSVSTGWRISEESFIKNNTTLSFIDNLKLRLSYGVMGDDGASSYQFITGYDYPYAGSRNSLASGYVFGGTFINSIGFRSSPNPNITWYTAKTSNIGFDGDFWHGLLGFSIDVFRRDRDGLLANRLLSLPGSFGAAMPQENLNSDQSEGFELSLSHRNKIRDFGYNISGNISFTRTKRIYVERAPSGNSYDNWRNNTTNRYNDVRFGLGYIGHYQSYDQIAQSAIFTSRSTLPGDYIYEDWNNDGVIDGSDYHPIATSSSNPLIGFGITIALNYKGFDLNMLVQGGAMSYVAYTEQATTPLRWDGNSLNMFLNRWHPVDPKADPYNPSTQWIQGYYANTGTNIDENSALNVQNNAYARLKSVELGYSIPKIIINKIGIQKLRFFVNAYNLLTVTGVKGLDPEHPSDSYSYLYPLSRTINLGATITF